MHHTVLCIHLNKGVALMNQYHSNAQQPAWRFVYSLVGILCFFIPFTINGNNTIFVDHVHLAIRSIIGPLMPYVALIMILIGTALPIVRRTFMTSITNLVITLFKVAGAIIGIMYVFKIGPSILFKANYGPFCLKINDAIKYLNSSRCNCAFFISRLWLIRICRCLYGANYETYF